MQIIIQVIIMAEAEAVDIMEVGVDQIIKIVFLRAVVDQVIYQGMKDVHQ